MDTTTADALIGRAVDGRYRIDRRIARGGMATVYEGFDTRLDRVVAVKVMHDHLAREEGFAERFRREAKSAARLSHPGVVAVYDQGESDGVVYLVMEHVPGRTLRDELRERGRLEPAEALRVVEGILEALAAAHAAGIVHRDVKPENVLLSGDRVRVADFGLARAVEVTSHTLADGALLGSVAYLAPEQVTSGAADARTDVYAVGVVLAEMLTGQQVFTGDSPLAVAYRHVQEDVPPPSAAVAGIPRAVDELVRAATAREPDARYPDAETMLSAVRRTRALLATTTTTLIDTTDAPTLAIPVPPRRPPRQPGVAPHRRPPRRRRTGLVVAIVVGLVLGIAGGVGWYLGSGRWVDAPPFLGLDRASAERLARDAGVGIRFGEPVFSETVPSGLVADQDPDAGDRLRRGGTLTLALSRGRDRVRLPDARNKPAAEARGLFQRVEVKTTEEHSDTVAEGRVVTQRPAPGTEVRPGSEVVLVVSRGPAPVQVPDLRGRPEDDAIDELARLGLKSRVERVFDDAVPAGRVVAQDVAPGTTTFRGQTVTIRVSKGPELVTVPNLVGKTRSQAREILRGIGLNSRIYGPNGENRRVFEQNPDPGTRLRPGSTVDLFVF